MDENTWRIVQAVMWLVGIQTTVIIASFGAMWIVFSGKFKDIDNRFNSLDSKFKDIDSKFRDIGTRFDKIDRTLEKIEQQINDIDKRVFAVETMLHMKDCCMLKDQNQLKKAE